MQRSIETFSPRSCSSSVLTRSCSSDRSLFNTLPIWPKGVGLQPTTWLGSCLSNGASPRVFPFLAIPPTALLSPPPIKASREEYTRLRFNDLDLTDKRKEVLT